MKDEVAGEGIDQSYLHCISHPLMVAKAESYIRELTVLVNLITWLSL